MSLQTTTNLPVDDHDPAPLQSQPLSSGTESGGAPVSCWFGVSSCANRIYFYTTFSYRRLVQLATLRGLLKNTAVNIPCRFHLERSLVVLMWVVDLLHLLCKPDIFLHNFVLSQAASGDGTRRTTGERHGQDDACIPLLQGLAPPTSWDNILSFAGGCLSFVGGLIGCVGAIVGCCCHWD